MLFKIANISYRKIICVHGKMNKQEEFNANSWLVKVGLRPTQQRVSLVKLLLGEKKHQHITAEELFKKAKKAKIPVSLATIYNTLHICSEAGLLNKIVVDKVRCYFDTRLDNHSHFYWEESGELSDAPGNFLEIKNLPNPPKNSEITNVDIIIRLKEKS